ncbi:MAG: hypothetical protein KAX11_00065 [Candidatus Aminicenantes bacterium]|nr:hypothetical protein [Candidatus Aminicenantes bacterium]
MEEQRLLKLLEKIKGIHAAIIGDVCLDAYWHVDMKRSELSKETPYYTRPIVKEIFSGGAMANVAANLSALGVSTISLFSILGKDWRGKILLDIFKSFKFDTSGIIWEKNRFTPTFLKPVLRGYETQQEGERYDFLTPSPPDSKTVERLYTAFEEAVSSFDCVLIGDQVLNGVITEDLIDRLSCLAAEYGEGKQNIVFTADSRTKIERFIHMVWKPNESEAARALGMDTLKSREETGNKMLEMGARLVFMTLGAEGCLLAEKNGTEYISGFKAVPPLDIVGAGDSFHAAMAVSLAAGADPKEAAIMGNLAASITTKKIGTTGTASPEEILKVYRDQKAKLAN